MAPLDAPSLRSRGLRALQAVCALAVLVGAFSLGGIAVNLPNPPCNFPACSRPGSGAFSLAFPALYLLLPAGLAALASAILGRFHLWAALASACLWAVGQAWVLALWAPNAANGAIALHPQSDWFPPVTPVPGWYVPVWVATVTIAEGCFLCLAVARVKRARKHLSSVRDDAGSTSALSASPPS